METNKFILAQPSINSIYLKDNFKLFLKFQFSSINFKYTLNKTNIGETMGTSIVVRTQIKEITKTMNISNDFQDELEKKVIDIINKAMWRAQQNKRTTIMARDLQGLC